MPLVQSRLSSYLTDKNLSLAAKGLLTIFMTHKEDDLDLDSYLTAIELKENQTDRTVSQTEHYNWHHYSNVVDELKERGYLAVDDDEGGLYFPSSILEIK